VFTGWENAQLTAQGEREAARAGALLAAHGVLPAFAHTSLQRRTIRTANLVLAAADRVVDAGQRPGLVDQAGPADGDADLLVVGSRGHGRFADAVLGSVGQYCVHHAHCPVLIMCGEPRRAAA